MQNRPYSLYPFCAVKPHSFIYSLSSPCVLMGLSLSSLVYMSVYVYCSIWEKVFPFYCICVHTFSYLSLPSCYIGTGTLLIDQPSYYWDVNLEFSVFNGCLWVITVVVFYDCKNLKFRICDKKYDKLDQSILKLNTINNESYAQHS